MKLKINIVGLTHNDVEQDCVEYAQTAKGKLLRLVADDANLYDPMAMKVYEMTTFVGYVAAQDLEDVRAALISQKGKKALRARCTGWGCKEQAKPKAGQATAGEASTDVTAGDNRRQGSVIIDNKTGLYITAEIDFHVEGDDGSEVMGGGKRLPDALQRAYQQVYDDSAYEAWHYSGPIINIDRLSRIDDCTDMLEDSLCELQENPSDAYLQQETQQLLADFMQNHRYDYSREMTQTRRRMVGLLEKLEKQPSADFFQHARKALLAEMGFIMSSPYREDSARNFFIDTPIQLLAHQMGTYDYSDRLDEIEAQLRAFPHDLYSKFLADPADFLRSLFYYRVPRKQMLQLLSGVILMVMNHRVDDVKRWGKHNDEMALDEMKQLKYLHQRRHSDEAEEMRKRVLAKRCCRLIAMIPNGKTGYGWILKGQADWYAVKLVLADEELIEPMENSQFEEYLKKIFPAEGKNVEALSKEELSLLPEGLRAEYRPTVPLGKHRDLGQAWNAVFENNKPSQWRTLSDEKLAGIQGAKYERYLAIADALIGMIKKGKGGCRLNRLTV